MCSTKTFSISSIIYIFYDMLVLFKSKGERGGVMTLFQKCLAMHCLYRVRKGRILVLVHFPILQLLCLLTPKPMDSIRLGFDNDARWNHARLYQPSAGCWCPHSPGVPGPPWGEPPLAGCKNLERLLVPVWPDTPGHLSWPSELGNPHFIGCPTFSGPFKPPEFTAPQTPSVTKSVCNMLNAHFAADSMLHYRPICIIIIATWQVVEAM